MKADIMFFGVALLFGGIIFINIVDFQDEFLTYLIYFLMAIGLITLIAGVVMKSSEKVHESRVSLSSRFNTNCRHLTTTHTHKVDVLDDFSDSFKSIYFCRATLDREDNPKSLDSCLKPCPLYEPLETTEQTDE
jgi:hypothetical protein